MQRATPPNASLWLVVGVVVGGFAFGATGLVIEARLMVTALLSVALAVYFWRTQAARPPLAMTSSANASSQPPELKSIELVPTPTERADGEMKFFRLSGEWSDGVRGSHAKVLDAAARRFEDLFFDLPIACFTTDLDLKVYEWNDMAVELWGRKPEQALEHEAIELIRGEGERDTFLEMANLATAGQTIEGVEIETTSPNGAPMWIALSVAPTTNASQKVTGLMWSAFDITVRKLQADRLKTQEEQLVALIDGMGSAALLLDADTSVIFANRRAIELLGYDRNDLVGNPFTFYNFAPVTAQGRPMELEEMPCLRTLAEGVWLRDVTIRLTDLHGAEFWINLDSAPVRLESGMQGAIVSFSDTTIQMANERTVCDAMEQIKIYSEALEQKTEELELANSKLEALATSDGLTGVKNNRAFREFLNQQFLAARRHGGQLSVALLDVDHFKSYNDEFGHPAGDEALKLVASTGQSLTRGSDLFARYGGEEFIMAYTATGLDGAMQAAERIRSAIEATKFPHRDVTVSIGVATLTASTLSAEELIEAADKALYESKRAGRNRVTSHAEKNAA